VGTRGLGDSGVREALIIVGWVATLDVVKVFVGEDGRGGNPLGVFLDGAGVPEERRQPIAAELGFPETVYVDDPRTGELRIFTPANEMPLAGHPLVGTAWLLARDGHEVDALRPPAGEVGVRRDGELTFVSARPEWAPRMDFFQLGSPAEVEAQEPPHPESPAAYLWAWKDEAAGTVRARGFFNEYGIQEDEATGSAALALCGRLGRPLRVHQGDGSLILAAPLADGRVEIGGRVEAVERREFPVDV
jgi:predicted PhzF superfamily epimerase YddE/YHI9